MRFIDPHHDDWRPLPDDGAAPAGGRVLLSWEQWQAQRERPHLDVPIGVWLPNTLDIDSVRNDVRRWSLIALQFPKWTDGRAYSQARLLRTRARFAGEIRATGQVLVDMLPLLQRSGFDAVQLRQDQSLESAQRALRFFASHYQGDVHEPRPLFAREAA